jgi:transcriptional regulator with XRE-family HTH domain
MAIEKKSEKPPSRLNRGAQELYKWRYNVKLTQRKCAAQLKCEPTQLSKWENGAAKPGRTAAVAIEKVSLGTVTCGMWDQAPLKEYDADPLLNYDPKALANLEE